MFENETSVLKVAVLIHLKGFRSNKTVMNSYWVFGGKNATFITKDINMSNLLIPFL